jgi:hypothetical protein
MDVSDFKHGIMALDKEGNILHFCGYRIRPTKKMFDHLKWELSTDEEIGLTDRIGEFVLVEAPQEVVNVYRNTGNDPNITWLPSK